ncbi:hypothetical protein [Amycolatopsis sp. MEPSY49]|uniref:hypothetical protein n=1 Tax=Amycolatopsis sp. MEPSY49 TaxID=3151600 RepID=UPI003EF9907F
MTAVLERLRNSLFRERNLGDFAVFVQEGLCSATEARRARWSAHRFAYGPFYLVGASLVLGHLGYDLVQPAPRDEWLGVVPLAMGPSLIPQIYLFVGAWGARFAGNRIQRQIAKLLDELGSVDLVGSGTSFRCRYGNPARLEQIRIRELRALLRRAAATVPGELLRLSGRGHQAGDLVTTDKVKNVFLDAMTSVPRPESGAERRELRKFLAVLSLAVMEADPYVRLERAVRAIPAACSARSAPLKTWAWRLHSLSMPELLSIIALPVAGFVVAKLSSFSTPTGLAVAGAATAVQAVIRYWENYKN